MSFGALSGPAKEALGRGASAAGTSTTTGDGGMTPEERGQSKNLVYQLLPSRYGMNPNDLRKADAIEVVIGQGAKPGGGGMLLGQKIDDRVAEMRTLPKGIDIVVKGSVGHMSAFMAQSGNLVVCGDAGEALGDSLYETDIYVKGKVKSLGADCEEKKMSKKHTIKLKELLKKAGSNIKPEQFKRYGSARKLYNFNIDNVSNY